MTAVWHQEDVRTRLAAPRDNSGGGGEIVWPDHGPPARGLELLRHPGGDCGRTRRHQARPALTVSGVRPHDLSGQKRPGSGDCKGLDSGSKGTRACSLGKQPCRVASSGCGSPTRAGSCATPEKIACHGIVGRENTARRPSRESAAPRGRLEQAAGQPMGCAAVQRERPHPSPKGRAIECAAGGGARCLLPCSVQPMLTYKASAEERRQGLRSKG